MGAMMWSLKDYAEVCITFNNNSNNAMLLCISTTGSQHQLAQTHTTYPGEVHRYTMGHKDSCTLHLPLLTRDEQWCRSIGLSALTTHSKLSSIKK